MAIEKTGAQSDDTAAAPTLSTGAAPTLRRLRDIDLTVSSSGEDIRGRMVRDKDGQEIGKIDALLVDDADQKVRLMEIASGGFLGFGESRSFIPIEAITRMTDEDVFISHTREHVAGAPRYDPDLVEFDPGYILDLYPYYGYPGTWVPRAWVPPRGSRPGPEPPSGPEAP